jgi:two-component system LytT family sensor kinase
VTFRETRAEPGCFMPAALTAEFFPEGMNPMDEKYLPYVVAEIFCAAYAAAFFFRLRSGSDLKREEKSLLRMIGAYIVLVVTDALSVFWENSRFSSMHAPDAAACAVSISAVALGCFFWLQFVELRLNPKAENQKRLKMWIRISAAALCLLDLLSAFTGWVFFINADGRYEEGPLFWVQELFTTVYLLIPTVRSLVETFRAPSREKRKEYLAYVVCICLGFVASELEDRMKTVPILELVILLAIQILFLTLYLDREHKLATQERELTNSRVAVMLSQIQPHFLFNAFAAIQEMCHGKAPEAEEAVAEFSEFVRGNLDSLWANKPIPFEKELSHTRNYLSLEKKRFGDRIRVEYDVRTTRFCLPALTLQPIVENAVRYGVMQREDGGTVRIASRETEKGFTVTVTDDGVGFDVMKPKADGRTHIGITNVRDRLKIMCGGDLCITSMEGKGSVAVITVPKEEQSGVFRKF